MLTTGHVAASYVIAKTAQITGFPITNNETLLIIAAGNILDLDLILGSVVGMKGEKHHNLPTHTPLGVILIWSVWLVTFGQYFSNATNLLLLLALFTHLILDDLGYWFCKLGWQEISKSPQINWLFPFRKFDTKDETGNILALERYFKKAKAQFIAEFLLVIIAFILI